jgi:hypothetical protein
VTLLGLTATTTTPALAGSNGQQINFCTGSTNANGRAQAIGFNQRGEYVTSPTVDLGGNGSCRCLSNWWWGGTVTIKWYSWNGYQTHDTSCYVPWNKSGDWVDCHA